MSVTSVITTINSPSMGMRLLDSKSDDFIVVGDKKTPNDWHLECVYFIPVDQENDFAVMKFLPKNHYSRKNIGYLNAIKNRTDCIYESDDDNVPNENWKERNYEVEARLSINKGWHNVYSLLTSNHIWPRGFSLKHLSEIPETGLSGVFKSSIQQGLADGEPDVDAIWRLTNNSPNCFDLTESIYLKEGVWCPFNSQSTWWFPKAYPLMYLPVTASFRMTDIWRSFIAQRCLWEIGEGVTFHSPSEVFQDRNEHDLLKDFEDEIPGYLKNDLIVETLNNLTLKQGVENICDNLLTCYKSLEEVKVFPMWEIRSVNAWIKDIKKIWK